MLHAKIIDLKKEKIEVNKAEEFISSSKFGASLIFKGTVSIKVIMRQWNFLISILTLGCSFASVSMAQEQLGTLSVSDLTLRPQGFYREQQEGEFVLGESSVGILWTLDDRLSSKFRIGAHSLRGKPKLYADTKSESDIDLVEAYGEYESLFGRFRIGLIPLEIGREGVLSESELIFPRSEIYSQGLVGLRDIGLNYFITYN